MRPCGASFKVKPLTRGRMAHWRRGAQETVRKAPTRCTPTTPPTSSKNTSNPGVFLIGPQTRAQEGARPTRSLQFGMAKPAIQQRPSAQGPNQGAAGHASHIGKIRAIQGAKRRVHATGPGAFGAPRQQFQPGQFCSLVRVRGGKQHPAQPSLGADASSHPPSQRRHAGCFV